jgi:hypothetical protein
VLQYRICLEQKQYAPTTINLRLATVRLVAYKAADSELLSPELAAGIRRVNGVCWLGVRIGKWLMAEEGKHLLVSLRLVKTSRMIRDLEGSGPCARDSDRVSFFGLEVRVRSFRSFRLATNQTERVQPYASGPALLQFAVRQTSRVHDTRLWHHWDSDVRDSTQESTSEVETLNPEQLSCLWRIDGVTDFWG